MKPHYFKTFHCRDSFAARTSSHLPSHEDVDMRMLPLKEIPSEMGNILREKIKQDILSFIGVVRKINAVFQTSYQNYSFKRVNYSYHKKTSLTATNVMNNALPWRATISTEVYSSFLRKSPSFLLRR